MDKIPLSRMYVDEEIKKAVNDVLDSGWYVKGQNARDLETEFAAFCQAKHGVSASSGTTAILMAMQALGIGKGDEVIVPSATFIATVNPIILLGGTPVFADIDPAINTMDPDKVKSLITPATKAIMPVHLYGHPADMRAIMDLAREHDIKVVADACQAHGAVCFGHNVGTIADIACFSFFPSKNMSVLGEGGMITTNDPEMARRMAMIKDHGRQDKHTSVMFGLNMRLSELHAAIGRVQLKHLSEWVGKRRENAALYTRLLEATGDIQVPVERGWAEHVYYVYVVKTKRRDGLAEHLKSRGISTGIHYPVPVHRQPFILDTLPKVDLPNTDDWGATVLSLPMDPLISKDDIERVVNEIGKFFDS